MMCNHAISGSFNIDIIGVLSVHRTVQAEAADQNNIKFQNRADDRMMLSALFFSVLFS